MLVIRLNRVGRKNLSQYRVVVQEKTTAPGGHQIAIVGSYNPYTKKAIFKKEEILTYLSHGAQASDTVHNLLVREGILKAEKRKTKTVKKKEELKK